MLKVGQNRVICKGKIVLGEKPLNMIYSGVLVTFPFIIFDLMKLNVFLLINRPWRIKSSLCCYL